MPSTTASKLDGLSQAVHLDHLRPAAKLFLHSTVNTDDDGDDQWIIRVYADVDESTAVWSGNVKWERVREKTERFSYRLLSFSSCLVWNGQSSTCWNPPRSIFSFPKHAWILSSQLDAACTDHSDKQSASRTCRCDREWNVTCGLARPETVRCRERYRGEFQIIGHPSRRWRNLHRDRICLVQPGHGYRSSAPLRGGTKRMYLTETNQVIQQHGGLMGRFTFSTRPAKRYASCSYLPNRIRKRPTICCKLASRYVSSTSSTVAARPMLTM